MEPSDQLQLGIFLCAAGLWGFWSGFRNLRLARIIEDTPTARIRSAHQGYVELEGLVLNGAAGPIVAPLSALPCAWFRYKIEEERQRHTRNGTQTYWQTVEKGDSNSLRFSLRDPTGQISIDATGAQIYPRHKKVWKGRHHRHRSAGLPAYIVEFLGSHRRRRYRFTEERILGGDPLYALGLLKNERSHSNQASVKQAAGNLLRQWKTDRKKLNERFDLDGSGEIDPKEWELARLQAHREIRRQRRDADRAPTENLDFLGQTGDSSRPFLLSSQPQKKVARRHRLRGSLGVALFIAGISGGPWLLFRYFGH
ncbi:MAG: hypothetical protein J4A00_05195 [Gammaproteobacteria bacterium]|nr:hypothetical protein [Gammaproteobacteria bacterium]